MVFSHTTHLRRPAEAYPLIGSLSSPCSSAFCCCILRKEQFLHIDSYTCYFAMLIVLSRTPKSTLLVSLWEQASFSENISLVVAGLQCTIPSYHGIRPRTAQCTLAFLNSVSIPIMIACPAGCKQGLPNTEACLVQPVLTLCFAGASASV